MEKKYQIFISSTYKDLIEARSKVRDAILSMMHFPVGMEMFNAADEEQWEIIQETIDSSDYYVLILGQRYGSVIESGSDAGISYTEKEFRYAREKKIPILVFIIDDDVAIKPEFMEKDLEHIKMTRNCNKTKFIDQTLMVFYIPGCTMVFNNCLMRKIQERKPEFDLITMHDCWLYYICLGIGGKIISDKNAYIQYRQHGNNVIGAKRISIRKKIQMICQQNGSPRAKMIDEIIRLYGQDMKKEMLSKYKTFASYPKSIKAKNYFFKQSTENVFSTRELQKAKLRILFGSL